VELLNKVAVADSLLESTNQHRPPVNLHAIISRYNGLIITRDDIDNAGYFIDLGERGGEIIVRAIDPPDRQRFTIAHELGHFVLRKELGNNIARMEKTDHARIERWCDGFATAILMPEHWIRESLDGMTLTQVVSKLPSIAESFHVSQFAVRLRLAEIMQISSCELESSDGRPVAKGCCYAATIEQADIDRVITEVADNVEPTSRPVTFRHTESGLFSAHRLVLTHAGQREWLVCIAASRYISRVFADPTSQTQSFSIPLSRLALTD
jgi:Zn-dependent peptidase ImmA (M78 family)